MSVKPECAQDLLSTHAGTSSAGSHAFQGCGSTYATAARSGLLNASQTVSIETPTHTALTTEELAAYARPELFHNVETRIEAGLLTPPVYGSRWLRSAAG